MNITPAKQAPLNDAPMNTISRLLRGVTVSRYVYLLVYLLLLITWYSLKVDSARRQTYDCRFNSRSRENGVVGRDYGSRSGAMTRDMSATAWEMSSASSSSKEIA